ncbi:hypothetical protein ACFWC5_42420 [Streptomyces sp. NPDC060085]|uniref:hypothetical protein n=1 Tax=Streptomyces sp. NPDC060085 TaxID=3347054 RepID=UPI0036588243
MPSQLINCRTGYGTTLDKPKQPLSFAADVLGYPIAIDFSQLDTMKGKLVGQKIIRFSDLSGKTVDDEDIVRVIVTQHPDLEGGPVELEALADELSDVEDSALDLVTFELYFPGEEEPDQLIMELDKFNALATDAPMPEIIKGATKVSRSAMSPRSGLVAAKARPDYASLEHAGKPHKGKTQDAEKKLVQEHLDEINERLKADGLRMIDLSNADHVARYGLETLAMERTKATS